jgi:Fe2+ or Zn2+ uptake regulation protein
MSENTDLTEVSLVAAQANGTTSHSCAVHSGPKKAESLLRTQDLTVETALRKLGIKVTKSRVSLLKVLKEEHGPFTIEELHERISRVSQDEICDLVTVYRSIGLFEGAGLVRRCDFGDGALRYEFQDNSTHHHHVVCRACRKVKSLDACFLQDLEKLLQKEGYSNVTHTLEFFALCEECSRSAVSKMKGKVHGRQQG